MVYGGGKWRTLMLDFCFFYHSHIEYETQPGAQLGLGLLSLATYAKHLGASVSVINAQGMPVTKALEMIPKCKHLMLYGCLIDRPMLDLIIYYVEAKEDVCYICIGGPIAKSIDTVPWPVAVLDGPGEDYIQDLCNGKFVPNKHILPPLKHNINNYSWPDRSLIQGGYGGNIFKHRDSGQSTTILTSRGCAHNCAFCSSGSNNFYQSYDLQRIESELEHCLSLGIKDIRISDDNLLGTRLNGLCDLFKEAGVRWRGSIRTYPNDEAMYEIMMESGCEELSFGIESGDQDVLDFLNKKSTVENNTLAIQNAYKAGIPVTRALMMMCTPGETENTHTLNMKWIEEAQPTSVSLKMFVPYPGTDIYENPDKYNCVINIRDVNNSAYRPDGSQPLPNIKLTNSDHDMLYHFNTVRAFIEAKGKENRG